MGRGDAGIGRGREDHRLSYPVASPQASTALDVRQSSTELERLSREFSNVKVLNVTNLAAAPDVSSSSAGFLSAVQRVKFVAKFGSVHGSWCCAPSIESKSAERAPSAATFRLMSAA